MADGDMVGAGVRVRTVMLDAGEWVIARVVDPGAQRGEARLRVTTLHGAVIAYARTPAELATIVDLAELRRDRPRERAAIRALKARSTA
ncbi:hypothetical protein [Nonomuraea dietziae]|uniref:hypothetical protein n=1 Tax=Nonomuraea dietziae TaxID=65515 RepID=UPI0033CB1E1C